MAFKKASPQQAKFKAGFYGKQGSGKTFTSLLVAEGLAKRDGKRVAYIDTERGTDFYAQAIKERRVHPEAFDFDALYTRSIYEAIEAVESLDTSVHGVVVLDSITHLWEAAQAAYTGQRMSNGQLPIHAWGAIKKPYKKLMSLILDGNFHAIICGREGVVMEKDEDGVMEVTGTKMKAEGETPYEPHMLARFCPERTEEGGYLVKVFFEKDRTGIFTGKTLVEPTYATFEPMMRYLSGDTQAAMGDAEDVGTRDAEAALKQKEAAEAERTAMYQQIHTAIVSATTPDALKAAWTLTSGKKTKLGDELMAKLTETKDAKKGEMAAIAVNV
jgi:hypothetical protein